MPLLPERQRGAGRGIAAALGEAGATVICTGRSTQALGSSRRTTIGPRPSRNPELVTRSRRKGHRIAVDHPHPGEVKNLADRVGDVHGHIDILVNDIWGAEVLKGGPSEWNTPVWKHDLAKGLRILRLGIDTHVITSHHLLPLVISRPGGLVVEVTDATFEYNATHYRISVFYDLAKISVNRLAFSQGHELKPHGAMAVSITPGWLRSEMMLENFSVAEERWRDALAPAAAIRAPAGFAVSESPRYVGRAVAALAADPGRQRWNQRSVTSGQLAATYGFTDSMVRARPWNTWKRRSRTRRGMRVPVRFTPRVVCCRSLASLRIASRSDGANLAS